MGKMKSEKIEDNDGKEIVSAANASTLMGDMRDAILDRMRGMKKPWQQMTESEQRMLNTEVEDFVKHSITRNCRMIAADGRKTIPATLESVTAKDGFKAVATISKTDENRHELIDAQGSNILIVVSDAEKFLGSSKPAKVDKDQPGLKGINDDEQDTGAVFDKSKLNEEGTGKGSAKK